MVISAWEERRCSLVSFNCNGLYLYMFQKKWAQPCVGRLTICVRNKRIKSLGRRTTLVCRAGEQIAVSTCWRHAFAFIRFVRLLYWFVFGNFNMVGRSSHPQIGRCAREDKKRQGSHSRSKDRGRTQTVRYFKRRPSNTLALWTTVW